MTYKDAVIFLKEYMKDYYYRYQYLYLWLFFVAGDCLTTYLMYNTGPEFVDLNPNIHYLKSLIPNNALFYVVFSVIKLIVLEILMVLIHFQNTHIKHSGNIVHTGLMIASIYIVINNLQYLNLI